MPLQITIRKYDENGVQWDYLMEEISKTEVTSASMAKQIIENSGSADEAVQTLAQEGLLVE